MSELFRGRKNFVRYFRLHKKNDDYFILMWNKAETAEGNFASLQGNKTTDKAGISTSKPPDLYRQIVLREVF